MHACSLIGIHLSGQGAVGTNYLRSKARTCPMLIAPANKATIFFVLFLLKNGCLLSLQVILLLVVLLYYEMH